MSFIEKTETKLEKIKQTIHYFYCDNCGEYLDAVEGHDDGYYHRPGEYNLPIHIDKECKQQLIDTLRDTLIKMGFKPE